MTRNTKIVLAVAAGVVVLLSICVCVTVLLATVWFRTSSVTMSPARFESSAAEAVQVNPGVPEAAGDTIVGITLPAGWQSDFSMHVAGFRLVGYKPGTGSGHIMLAVLPETPAKSTEEMEKELSGLAGTHGFRWNLTEMSVVDRKPVTIRGQATEMVIYEGTGSSGAWREAVASFKGDQGLTLLIYGMPKDSYSQADADALFASIR